MFEGLQWLGRNWGWVMELAGQVLVLGDSHLVISFLKRQAVPNRKELVVTTRNAQELTRTWKGVKVTYSHVPRTENTWADWLARVAHAKEGVVKLGDLADGVAAGESAPMDLHPALLDDPPTNPADQER